MLKTLFILLCGLVTEFWIVVLFWILPASRWLGIVLLLGLVVVPFATLWVVSRLDRPTRQSDASGLETRQR